jgi:hypothetical protein
MPMRAEASNVTKGFKMKLNAIQPSQLYISSEKLSEVMKAFDPTKPESLEPMPVKKLGNRIILVDGHTRALAAFIHDFSEVMVYWEDEELDWDEYEVCVKWCEDEGIRTIADLKNRIVSQEEYHVLWLKRCEKMQQELATKRRHSLERHL